LTIQNDSIDENDSRDDNLTWKMTSEMIFEFLNQQGIISSGKYSTKSARYSIYHTTIYHGMTLQMKMTLEMILYHGK